MDKIELKYGCNPHQIPSSVLVDSGKLPFKLINGNPGYINILDALNSWQLVSELSQATGLPAAASFKHVSPAGAAVGVPLPDNLKKAYFVEDIKLSSLAAAYARARGADRMSSFGDWIGLSNRVDVSTAELIKKEISHGIIAPSYEEEALSILKRKRKGKYVILEMDSNYEPGEMEDREVFGITLRQKRNIEKINYDILDEVVAGDSKLDKIIKRDMVVSLVALKYTQSNSVCLTSNGQIIGMGAGQQSRIHCTRLAAGKAERWFLKQHPSVSKLKFKEGLGRPDRDNAIELYFHDDLTSAEEEDWEKKFREVPERLSRSEKKEWLDKMDEIVLGSDGFIPFRDNVDRAHQSGVKYIVQPGGSIRDGEVIQACNDYGMVMVFTGLRLFHH